MLVKNYKGLNWIQIVLVCLFFLAGMNFAQKCYYFIYIAFFLTVLIYIRDYKLDICAIILLLFSSSCIIFSTDARSDIWQVMKCLAYPMCYLAGMNFVPNSATDTAEKSDEMRKVALAIIIVGMGPFAHYLLNMLTNIGNENRNTVDFWTKDAMGATGQATMAAIAVAIFFSVLFTTEKLQVRILAIIGIGSVLTYNMVLAGRTLLVLSLVVFIVAFLYTYRHNKKQTKRRNIYIVLGIILILGVVYTSDLFGMRTYIETSNLVVRFQDSESTSYLEDQTRMEIRLEYLKRVTQYPFGGGKIRSIVGYYAHDLYLDTYNETGFFGWFFLTVFMIVTSIQMVVDLRRCAWSISNRNLVLCVFVSLHLVFFTEPILSGMPWMLCIFCFYRGMINGATSVRRIFI